MTIRKLFVALIVAAVACAAISGCNSADGQERAQTQLPLEMDARTEATQKVITTVVHKVAMVTTKAKTTMVAAN